MRLYQIIDTLEDLSEKSDANAEHAKVAREKLILEFGGWDCEINPRDIALILIAREKGGTMLD